MKRFVILCLMVTAALCLTAVAHADAIVGPVDMVISLAYLLRPFILVAAVAIVTLVLLRKFRKKK